MDNKKGPEQGYYPVFFPLLEMKNMARDETILFRASAKWQHIKQLPSGNDLQNLSHVQIPGVFPIRCNCTYYSPANVQKGEEDWWWHIIKLGANNKRKRLARKDFYLVAAGTSFCLLRVYVIQVEMEGAFVSQSEATAPCRRQQDNLLQLERFPIKGQRKREKKRKRDKTHKWTLDGDGYNAIVLIVERSCDNNGNASVVSFQGVRRFLALPVASHFCFIAPSRYSAYPSEKVSFDPFLLHISWLTAVWR